MSPRPLIRTGLKVMVLALSFNVLTPGEGSAAGQPDIDGGSQPTLELLEYLGSLVESDAGELIGPENTGLENTGLENTGPENTATEILESEAASPNNPSQDNVSQDNASQDNASQDPWVARESPYSATPPGNRTHQNDGLAERETNDE